MLFMAGGQPVEWRTGSYFSRATFAVLAKGAFAPFVSLNRPIRKEIIHVTQLFPFTGK